VQIRSARHRQEGVVGPIAFVRCSHLLRRRQIAFADPGTIAWSTHPPARQLSMSPPPSIIRATASNQLGNEVVWTSVSNQRRRSHPALADALTD
jgi:hypothetical protein